MATTLASLRAIVREEAGDEERVSGTATGGSLTEVIDTAKLTQADNAWAQQIVFIKTTTDNAAPKGEARRIASSTQSTKKLTTTLPFSVTVESGDTYAIAVFSDAQVNRAINNAIAEFSKYVPWVTTETLAVTAGNFRFAPTSASAIRYIERIEYVNNATRERIKYDGAWFWDETAQQVEFDFWWEENKSLTLYLAREHRLLSADSDELSVRASEEMFIIKLAVAELFIGITQREFKDDYGKLKPKSMKWGEVSESYGETQEYYRGIRESVIQQLQAMTASLVVGRYPRGGRNGAMNDGSINTHAEPGWVAPTVFWERN